MENSGEASWEQVHKILFPGGQVPASLINSNQANGSASPGAGILGPRPASPPPPGFGFQENAANFPGGHSPPTNPMPANGPPKDGFFGVPPPAPRDPQLLHYIKLFAAFVAKFGVENEALVRARHQGRPEFSFLFGGEPGSEAGIGSVFYEWQKGVIVKLLDAMKGLAEGKIPPDRIKSMRRELEQCINNGTPLKDLRLETVLGLNPEGKLDWQTIAWELGVTIPGDKRSQQLEPPEKAPGMIKLNGDFPHELHHGKEWSLKPERPRELNEEFSPGGRRRRKRSRSRTPDRVRHRFRSRSPPPRRSPRRSRTPPPRRNRRSYSRSPPWRRSSPPPPRRGNDRKREVEDEYVMPFPPRYGTQHFHHLAPPPPPASILHAPEHLGNGGGGVGGGFMENSFGRFMPPPVLESVGSSSAPPPPLHSIPPPPPPPITQDHSLLMSAFSQVVAPFQAPALSENFPLQQQQQLLLQQLQFQQMPSLGNQQPPPVMMPPVVAPQLNAWPNTGGGDAAPLQQFVSPPQMIAPLFNNHQLPHQQQQQSLAMNPQQAMRSDPASPPHDPETEAAGDEAGKSSGKARDSKEDESGKGSDKEKDSRALKIVRNTVAEFVKELLTPKWKDGVLSKDDFKVIAQKAVNKVVGNLQGSQIPKGSERVDRFMTSSREKITKLVQEYVEKHTKNAPPAPPASTNTTTTSTTAEAAA